MQKFKMKLIAAGVSVTVALVLLVSASFAWFTTSTAPEISGIHIGIKAQRTLLLSRDTETLDFNQYIDLTDDFAYLTPLHPVSTVDGINWFIPTYNEESGALNDPDDFILDDKLEYANVTTLAGVSLLPDGTPDIHDRSSMYDPNNPGQLKAASDISELTGRALQERSDLGYYVYADFWMVTEEDNGCRVRLTVPHYDTRSQLEDEEIEQGSYGSYVLQTCELVEGEDGNSVALLSRKAETSMRVGFLLNPDTDTAAMITKMNQANGTSLDAYTYSPLAKKFLIYEPNAEKRSAANKPLGGETEDGGNDGRKVDYIVGYKFNSDSYENGMYFATQPIMAVTKIRTNPDTGANENYIGGTPVNIPTDRLLIQKSSEWELDTLKETLENGEKPDSNDVAYPMGGFLNTTSVYDTLNADTNSENEINNESRIADISTESGAGHSDVAGSSVIVTLKKDTPLKIRLFVWIEGQDVDCWNDIAAGSFIVNLELAGESIQNAS